MNKFSESGARRLSAKGILSAEPAQERASEQRPRNQYGMSEQEYTVYVQDCRESEQFCADAHTYFSNYPDVLQNFF